MWDSMIENARKIMYQYERKTKAENSSFCDVVNSILIYIWTKSRTSFHYLTHYLNQI